MAIPRFQLFNGNLPPGSHSATWDEFSARFGRNVARERLLRGLREVLDALGKAGCRKVYVDGSFVTSKVIPGDFHACWDAEGVDLDPLDPVVLDFSDRRAAQKQKYFGELFPMSATADPIGRTFLEFFQVDKRSGKPKGIVLVEL